jgi:penicillin amidase
LLDWDRRVAANSIEAALYVAWERSVFRRLVAMRIDPSMVVELTARASARLVSAVTNPSQPWFTAQPARARDELLVAALADAVASVQAGQAGLLRTWASLHTALFRHPLGVTASARRRFNIGPFERDGYADTVMSTGGVDLEQTTGATFRMIADVGNWDRSLAMNAPGQSEAPASPHFADLAKLWSGGEYFPLAFSEAAVQANAETVLSLMPR